MWKMLFLLFFLSLSIYFSLSLISHFVYFFSLSVSLSVCPSVCMCVYLCVCVCVCLLFPHIIFVLSSSSVYPSPMLKSAKILHAFHQQFVFSKSRESLRGESDTFKYAALYSRKELKRIFFLPDTVNNGYIKQYPVIFFSKVENVLSLYNDG